MQSSCVTPTPQKETEMPTKALQAAIELAAVGLPTFPCLENKHPATPHGFKDAAADPDKLRALWAQYPGELIAVPTGTVSGLDALDLDTKHEEARTWWRVNCRRFPSTRMHHTRAGGMHLIFRHDGGMRCSAGKIVWASIRAPAAGTSSGGLLLASLFSPMHRQHLGRHGSWRNSGRSRRHRRRRPAVESRITASSPSS
jgi:hypothetical protein